MQIFLDSANTGDIRKWLEQGVVDGVTTNPSILLKDGVHDLEEGARQLAALLHPRPVSVEVTTNNPEEMIAQGRAIARWAPNLVIKIPVVNQDGESCLGAIHGLARDSIAVNATAILSFNQAILAAKAGATYVSIFAGRVADEGHDADGLVRAVHGWLAAWNSRARILVGSVRGASDVQHAAIAGAHIVTIPPALLAKMVDHQYSRATVRQFNQDAARALEQSGQLRFAHAASR